MIIPKNILDMLLEDDSKKLPKVKNRYSSVDVAHNGDEYRFELHGLPPCFTERAFFSPTSLEALDSFVNVKCDLFHEKGDFYVFQSTVGDFVFGANDPTPIFNDLSDWATSYGFEFEQIGDMDSEYNVDCSLWKLSN